MIDHAEQDVYVHILHMKLSYGILVNAAVILKVTVERIVECSFGNRMFKG